MKPNQNILQNIQAQQFKKKTPTTLCLTIEINVKLDFWGKGVKELLKIYLYYFFPLSRVVHRGKKKPLLCGSHSFKSGLKK